MFTLPMLSGGYAFPDDNVPEYEKLEKEFGLAAARALYSRFCLTGAFFTYTQWNQMQEIRNYGAGQQSDTPYRNWFTNGSPIGGGQNGTRQTGQTTRFVPQGLRKAYANISYKIFSPMPKLTNVLLSVLSDNDYKLDCVSLDRTVVISKKKKKSEIYVRSKFINPIAKQIGAPQMYVPFVPRNEAEIEVADRLGVFKTRQEVALEKLAESGFRASKWKDLRHQFNRDAIDFHFRIAKLYNDHDTGQTKVKYVDPARTVMLWNEDNQEEPAAIGHIEVKTIQEIYPKLKEAGYSDERISMMAKQQVAYQDAGVFTQPWIFERKDTTTNRWLWMDFKVYVLEFEYLSTDYSQYVERVNSKGEKTYLKNNTPVEDKKKNKKEKYDEYRCNYWYEGCYIISGNGQDMLYDWRKKPNQMQKGLTPMSSYVFDRILGTSPTYRCIGLLDDLMMAMLKLRAAVFAAAPKGYTIDIGEGANIKIGGVEYDLFDLATVHRQNGIRVVATKFNAATGKYISKPLEENDNGLGPQGAEWIQQIANIQMMIKDTIGIPDAMAASPDQSAERLVGVMEGDYQAGNHANWQLRESERRFKEKIGERIIHQARIDCQYDPQIREFYATVIGDTYMDAIDDMEGLSLDKLGISTRVLPNEKEKDAILQRAMAMSQRVLEDGTTLLKASDIERVAQMLKNDEVDEAIWFMTRAESDAEMRSQAFKEKMAQMTFQGQQQSALVTEQAKAKTKMMEIQMDIQKERELANIELMKQMELQKLKNDGTYEVQILKGQQALDEIQLEATLEAQLGSEITGRV